MIKQVIINKVKHLSLPKGSYVVFGSAPLAVAGLREANDIDLLVSDELFAILKNDGWREVDKKLSHDIFEAYKTWHANSYRTTLEQLLPKATVINEIPIASLEDVREWKLASARPKDLIDVDLIDKHLNQ